MSPHYPPGKSGAKIPLPGTAIQTQAATRTAIRAQATKEATIATHQPSGHKPFMGSSTCSQPRLHAPIADTAYQRALLLNMLDDEALLILTDWKEHINALATHVDASSCRTL
eukprot:1121421-Pelagomonas_calceolata.AAC.1